MGQNRDADADRKEREARELRDTLLYLARNLDDHTSGNETIVMDWGNVRIDCHDTRLKSLLVELARDYLRLRAIEDAIARRQEEERAWAERRPPQYTGPAIRG